MSENGEEEKRDPGPPPEEHNEDDEAHLESFAEFISHLVKIGNGLVKEVRFSAVQRKTYVTDYMVERMSREDVIGLAENLMKARVDHLKGICDGYEMLQGNTDYWLALSIIRAVISENFELIEWEYENFSSPNPWAHPRPSKWNDNMERRTILQKIRDVVAPEFIGHDWLFSHHLWSLIKMGWYQGHERVVRQRLTFGKELPKPEKWNFKQYLEEISKKVEPLTMVEENLPSSKELICSFIGSIDQNGLFREIRIRYTNDMLDFMVPDLEALIDEVRAMIMEQYLKTSHQQLWTAVLEGINMNNVKYIYALFKKGPAALERFEDENVHKDFLPWNVPGKIEKFWKFFNKTLHYETTTPVPMSERRNPLFVQTGMDFIKGIRDGTLKPGSNETPFSSRPLTEADLYPSESQAAQGEQKEKSTECEKVESVPKNDPNQIAAGDGPVTKLVMNKINGTAVKSGSKHKTAEIKTTKKSAKTKHQETVATNKQVVEDSTPHGSQILISTNEKPTSVARVPSSPVVVTSQNTNEITNELTIIKKTEEVEPAILVAKPALSYAKVVKKSNKEDNGTFEVLEKALKSPELSDGILNLGKNGAEVEKQNNVDDESEWTQVVSKSHENRSQKKKQDDKKNFQRSVPSTVTHKKVLKSLDSKDTDETSSNSSCSVDIKSQHGQSKNSRNSKKSQHALQNGTTNGTNKETDSGNTSESSEKHGKKAWALSTETKKEDVIPETPVAQLDIPQAPVQTQTAIKKAKKAAAAQRRLENLKSMSSTETAPKKTEKLVMVADDNSVTEAELDVKIKDQKQVASKKNNKKKAEHRTGLGNSSSTVSEQSSLTKQDKKNLTTVEAHITDKTGTMIVENALCAVFEKTLSSQGQSSSSIQNQEPEQSCSSSNLQRVAIKEENNGNSSNKHARPQIVHDYRPGVQNNDGESSTREASLEREEVALAANDDEQPEAEQEVALANPEQPINEVAASVESHKMFQTLKEFSDNRNTAKNICERNRRKLFKARSLKFDLAYLFRMRIAKGMLHILSASGRVEAATTREDSTTNLLIHFLIEPLDNQNSLRGQNLDNIRLINPDKEAEEILSGLRYLDLRLAELAPGNEIRSRYQVICDKLVTVMREQEIFYKLLTKKQ